jgi:hypothetical protein
VTGGVEKAFVSEIYNWQLNSDSLQDSHHTYHENKDLYLPFTRNSKLTALRPTLISVTVGIVSIHGLQRRFRLHIVLLNSISGAKILVLSRVSD